MKLQENAKNEFIVDSDLIEVKYNTNKQMINESDLLIHKINKEKELLDLKNCEAPPEIKIKWKGNNYTCCNGEIYVSPKFYFGLLTQLYIISYSLIFTINVLNVIF